MYALSGPTFEARKIYGARVNISNARPSKLGASTYFVAFASALEPATNQLFSVTLLWPS